MSKPNYFEIAEEQKGNGPISALYVFTEELTEAEKELFDYVKRDYFIDNPGTVSGEFSSVVGTYYTEDGETT